MKRPLSFFGKLLLLSLLLIPLFAWFDAGYLYVIRSANVRPLKQIAYVSSDALYPFFVLILATPKLGIRKRTMSIVLAVVLALSIDLTMIYEWGTYPFKQEPNPTIGHIWAGETWHMMMRWLLPVLLWLIVAHKQIEELFKGDALHES